VTEFLDRILGILRGCPCGLTTKEIAERLGVTPGNISSRLSKLAAYGIIKRPGAKPLTMNQHVPFIMLRLPCLQPKRTSRLKQARSHR